jgi:cytochrome c5
LFLLLAAIAGCRRKRVAIKRAPPETFAAKGIDAWSDVAILAEGRKYLDDPRFRRRALVASLANPDNAYSRIRLTSYALGNRGWDQLPEWNPQSVVLDDTRIAALRTTGKVTEVTTPVWNGKRPTAMAEWIALGREVFFRYPLRAEVFLEHALRRPELADAVGIMRANDGTWPGGIAFNDIDGKTKIGITCALCHSNVENGAVVIGRARRSFDYGRLRLAFHKETSTFVDPELARRMATWGPGRADVTEDDAEDPVAIPDLFGLRAQPALTQAGTVLHIGPTALAIRQETQLLHSNHQKIRPPRELSWALAMFVYSLTPPPRERVSGNARGAELFGKHCRSCHSNSAFGGPTISAGFVGTDRSLADGGARGTGRYRPPSLLRVAEAAPYLHNGSIGTLEDLFDNKRLAADYEGPLGKGAVVGHRWGTEFAPPDREALIEYLRTL